MTNPTDTSRFIYTVRMTGKPSDRRPWLLTVRDTQENRTCWAPLLPSRDEARLEGQKAIDSLKRSSNDILQQVTEVRERGEDVLYATALVDGREIDFTLAQQTEPDMWVVHECDDPDVIWYRLQTLVNRIDPLSDRYEDLDHEGDVTG